MEDLEPPLPLLRPLDPEAEISRLYRGPGIQETTGTYNPGRIVFHITKLTSPDIILHCLGINPEDAGPAALKNVSLMISFINEVSIMLSHDYVFPIYSNSIFEVVPNEVVFLLLELIKNKFRCCLNTVFEGTVIDSHPFANTLLLYILDFSLNCLRVKISKKIRSEGKLIEIDPKVQPLRLPGKFSDFTAAKLLNIMSDTPDINTQANNLKKLQIYLNSPPIRDQHSYLNYDSILPERNVLYTMNQDEPHFHIERGNSLSFTLQDLHKLLKESRILPRTSILSNPRKRLITEVRRSSLTNVESNAIAGKLKELLIKCSDNDYSLAEITNPRRTMRAKDIPLRSTPIRSVQVIPNLPTVGEIEGNGPTVDADAAAIDRIIPDRVLTKH